MDRLTELLIQSDLVDTKPLTKAFVTNFIFQLISMYRDNNDYYMQKRTILSEIRQIILDSNSTNAYETVVRLYHYTDRNREKTRNIYFEEYLDEVEEIVALLWEHLQPYAEGNKRIPS